MTFSAVIASSVSLICIEFTANLIMKSATAFTRTKYVGIVVYDSLFVLLEAFEQDLYVINVG